MGESVTSKEGKARILEKYCVRKTREMLQYMIRIIVCYVYYSISIRMQYFTYAILFKNISLSCSLRGNLIVDGDVALRE